MDMLTEDLMFYNVCKAKTCQTTTGHCNCEIAFPANMWKGTTGWKFYCSVDWSVLGQKEGHKHPSTRNPVTM
eukprot:12915059-Prorocentrum_lima.AAC.1